MSTTNDSTMSRRLALALVAAAAACRRTPTLQRLDHVRIKRVTEGLPKRDPGSSAWDDATEYEASLVPQNVTAPMLQRPGVSRVKVRALHDGEWVAFRLEWSDTSRGDVQGPSRFSDAAAVQLPRDAGAQPSPMMGHPSAPVRILYWKAAWQTEDMLQALHPNRPPTLYPFEVAPPEVREEMARSYAPAVAAHNPNHHEPGDPPVFVGEAEMFGTLTAVANARADGRGVFKDNTWRVALSMPLAMLNDGIHAGRESTVAFAVWEGAGQNAGARKMRSEQWVKLVME